MGSLFSDVSPGGTSLLAGDTNQNGIPGEYPDDFLPIRNNFRTAQTERTAGDLVNDDVIDFLDYREWKTAFETAGGNPADIDWEFAAVPEPGAGVMAAIACAALGRIRRRR
jgi:hypothetical protein